MKSIRSTKNNPQVKIVSQKTFMRFRPLHIPLPIETKAPIIEVKEQKPQSSISGWFRREKKSGKTPYASTETTVTLKEQSQRTPIPRKTVQKSKPLKFLCRLSSEHILVGNEYQLDAFGAGSISHYGHVQTEFCWSMHLEKKNIDLVAVDPKSKNMSNLEFNLLAIVSGHSLYVYKYDFKKMSSPPVLIQKQIELKEVPLFMQITRDSTITLMFQKKLEIFVVSQGVRKKFSRQYQLPEIPEEDTIHLLMVPEAYQTILNIFFEQKKRDSTTFGLWCLQVEFLPGEVKLYAPQKVYDIKNSLRKSLKLTNYSRDIFLMNLGSQIYALKRGYILDSANVNLKHEQSQLHYLGQNHLLHISAKKIQIYNFIINTSSKPYRIRIQPCDSIVLNQVSTEDQVVNVQQIYSNQFALFLQKKRQFNRLKNEEVQYSFYITRPISRQEKIDALFPRSNFQQIITDPSLADKCDMAEKMGLSRKQVYFELWNRSQKKSEEDYRLLICTRDYDIIQQEVSRKLKKASMSFKQIKRIEDQCFQMLEQIIFSPFCTQKVVQHYISCHFFRRKLDNLRDLYFMGEKGDRHQKLKVSIQEYQSLKIMDIKSEVMNMVSMMCYEGKIKCSIHIRLLLINFKFVFRTIYRELLHDMIIAAKDKLIILLKEIPEILPFEHEDPPEQEVKGLHEGVWPIITEKQWRESLYLQNITTIDNKDVILDYVVKGLWFRRNWLTHHDMVIDGKEKIKKTWEEIQNQKTFFFFIEKMFEEIQDQDILKEVIEFIEQKYSQKIPEKMRGSVFLLHEIWKYLQREEILPLVNNRPCRFSEFLEKKAPELFRHFFLKERSMKGLLLKQIKPICENSSSEGNRIFNEGLLDYFASDLSEVSDLKYILNRINNQKLEFHQKNQEMYEVLVEALERKLKIGTQDDIPVEEVLIYIDNIPLKVSSSFTDEPCRALQELKSVQKINSEIETLKQAKIDMTLYDILHQQEDVLTKLVNHAVESEEILQLDSTQESKSAIENFTYRMVASLEHLSEQIYEQPNSYNIFFIYLSKLCERKQMIHHVKHLLNNEYMIECYEDETAENLVQYMYRWKLFNDTVIIKSADYINQLLTLIPEESPIHQYICSELEFAKILSSDGMQVQYPISEGAPTLMDVKNTVQKLPVKHVLTIDIHKLHEVTSVMQRIVGDEFSDEQENLGEKPVITLHQTYEIVLMKLIKDRRLKQVLPLIRKIMQIPIPDPTYNIVYIVFFIIEIAPELNEENKLHITECIAHYFYDAWGLLEIVEKLVNHPFTSTQRKDFIQSSLSKGKKKYRGFNPDNKIFNRSMVDLIMGNRVLEVNFLEKLQKTTYHLQHTKQEFRKINYAVFMTMMHNSPYALAKYIHCKDNLNLKYIRSFLSYIIKEDVFDEVGVLELGRRIFLIILYSMKENIPIEMAIDHYCAISLKDEFDDFEFDENSENQLEAKIWKSAEAFRKKKEAIKAEILLREKREIAQSNEDRLSRYESELKNLPPIEERSPAEYPFRQIDSDDNNENDEFIALPINNNRQASKGSFAFDPREERKKLLKKGRSTNTMFMSTQGEGRKPNHQFSQSIRLKLKNSPTLNFQDFLELEKQENKVHSDQKEKHSYDDFQLRNSEVIKVQTPESRQRKYSAHEEPASSPEIRVNLPSPVTPKYGSEQQSEELIPFNEEEREGESEHKFESEVSNDYKIQINIVESDGQQEHSEEKMKEIKIDLNDSAQIPIKRYEDEISFLKQELIEVNRQALLDEMGEPKYDLSLIKKIEEDVLELRSLVKSLYEDNELAAEFQRINIIKFLMVINLEFPILNISSDVFGIYYRAEDLQTKLCLQLPFCEIFVTDGLFRKFTDNEELFLFINPYVQKIIDDGNVYKIAKFLSLVFHMHIENDIFYQYLWTLIQQNAEVNDALEIKRVTEKISVLVNKLEVKTLIENFESLYNHISESLMKEKILLAVCKAVKQKISQEKEQKILFFKKILQKNKNPQYSQMLRSLDR